MQVSQMVKETSSIPETDLACPVIRKDSKWNDSEVSEKKKPIQSDNFKKYKNILALKQQKQKQIR